MEIQVTNCILPFALSSWERALGQPPVSTFILDAVLIAHGQQAIAKREKGCCQSCATEGSSEG